MGSRPVLEQTSKAQEDMPPSLGALDGQPSPGPVTEVNCRQQLGCLLEV